MGIAIAVASIVLSGVRFLWIEADFPAGLNWSGDLYTDEGWYLSGAISHAATGNWLVRGDFNPIVNMPMQQVLQALVFEVAGISLASARCTVAAWSIWVILGTYLLVRRYAGSLPGGLAALILSSNFTFFAYSRLALNEIPVMGWALLTVLALTGRPSRRSASIAAVLYAAAILTKPTALFALPVVLFMIWHRARNGKEVALDVGVFVLVVALLAGGYHLWALGHFPADYHYFNTLNIDSRVSLDLRTLIWNGLRTFRHSLVLDPLMWPLALVAAVALLAISNRASSQPAVVECGALAGRRIGRPAHFKLPSTPILPPACRSDGRPGHNAQRAGLPVCGLLKGALRWETLDCDLRSFQCCADSSLSRHAGVLLR